MYWRWALRSLSSSARLHGRDAQRFYSSGPSVPLLCKTSGIIRPKSVLGCRETYFWGSHGLHDIRYQVQQNGTSAAEEPQDPFSLVSDELSAIANRLRSMVIAEVPKLAQAAEYFFRMGVEGKRFRPTILLLMSRALNVPILHPTADGVFSSLKELGGKQQRIAEITEMIHVASLLHDDVLDDAETRRGIGSLNCVMGNKGLAYQLTDDILDFTGTSNSLGKGSLSDINQNIITAPILFAMEEFPQLREVVDRGFGNRSDVDLAVDYLFKSRGIERARELAQEHADNAVKAIEALPGSDDEDVIKSRRALVDLTHRVITRTK